MRKRDRIVLDILVAVFFSIVMACSFAYVYSYDKAKDDIHLIIFAQDAKTEVEIQVDKKKHTELLDAGVNYISYKTSKHKAAVWAYGDKITPRIDKGRDGDYYAIVCVTPPGESVGE